MISYQKDNLAISYFKNSHFNDTFFIGYINNYEIITDLKIGLSAGVSYGYSLGKILKKESFLRKKLYDKYDKWDKPILPLAYMYIEYRIIKKHNIGIGITPNLAFTTYYKLKY